MNLEKTGYIRLLGQISRNFLGLENGHSIRSKDQKMAVIIIDLQLAVQTKKNGVKGLKKYDFTDRKMA